MVAVAASVQVLIALTFVVIPIIAHRYGDSAQLAAEQEFARQGASAAVLAEHHVRFAETRKEMLFPFAIAAVMLLLAASLLLGVDVGRTLTWILQPVLMLAGGFVTASQIFAARYVRAVFRRSRDDSARALDTDTMVAAAAAAFPAIARPLQIARFVLVTAGSLLVIVVLATR